MSGWWAAAFVVLWILVALLAIVVVALARQIGVLQLRLAPLGALEVDDEGPALGEAPEARPVRTPDGSRRVIGGPGPGRLVAFVSDTCPICEQVAPSPAAAVRAGWSFSSSPIRISRPRTASRAFRSSWCSTRSASSGPRGP